MRVYLFHGVGSKFTNSVFSTREAASHWIAKHGLTGLLTAYDVDRPAFDRQLEEGGLPRWMRKRIEEGALEAMSIERYVDGSEHYHYYLGVGEGEPGFEEAADRWNAEFGPPTDRA